MAKKRENKGQRFARKEGHGQEEKKGQPKRQPRRRSAPMRGDKFELKRMWELAAMLGFAASSTAWPWADSFKAGAGGFHQFSAGFHLARTSQ